MDGQPSSNPDTHKKEPRGKAIIFPIHAPEVAMPTSLFLSFIGAQCAHMLETAGQNAP